MGFVTILLQTRYIDYWDFGNDETQYWRGFQKKLVFWKLLKYQNTNQNIKIALLQSLLQVVTNYFISCCFRDCWAKNCILIN